MEAPGLGSTFFSSPQGLPEFYNSIFADPAGFDVVNHHLNSNGWQFCMRELYFSATPVKPVTVEAGFIGIERGLSTEITTFDEDGYLSGERVRVHDPKHLFVDEISFTSAFLGDYSKPNLFVRGSSLKKANYRQVAAKKSFEPACGCLRRILAADGNELPARSRPLRCAVHAAAFSLNGDTYGAGKRPFLHGSSASRRESHRIWLLYARGGRQGDQPKSARI